MQGDAAGHSVLEPQQPCPAPPTHLAQGARHLALRVDRVDQALHLEPRVTAVLKRLFEAQAELLAARVQRQSVGAGQKTWEAPRCFSRRRRLTMSTGRSCLWTAGGLHAESIMQTQA